VISEPPPSSRPLTTDALLAAVTPAVPEVKSPGLPAAARGPSLRRTAMMEFAVIPLKKEQHAAAADDDSSVRGEPDEDALDPDEETPPSGNPALESRPPPVALDRVQVTPSISPRDAVTVRPRTRRGNLVTSVFLPAGVSAGVVFGVFNWGVMPMLEKPAPEMGPAAAVSVPLPAPPKPKAEEAKPITEKLPLPKGIEVQNGLGLLEVEVNEPLALYVDGEFMGKVVLRRAPLKPGRHQLTIGEGQAAKEVSVDITVGARTRVTLPAAPR
jgi:hypothetical protein